MNGAKRPTQVKTFERPIWIPGTSRTYSCNTRVSDPVNRLTIVALTNTSLQGMIGPFVGELMQAAYAKS